MAISGVNNFNNAIQQLNSATSVVKSAISLAKDLQGGNLAGAIKDIGGMFQGMSNLTGGTSGSNAASKAPMSSKAQDVASLFGQGDPFEADNKKKAESAKAAAAGGGAMSLGALLAMVGGILVKSIESTMKQLAAAAKELDGATQGGGPTAALNQKIQELTFNLQQIQQTLNRVNETVTNLSRSQSDAQKTTAQNLSV